MHNRNFHADIAKRFRRFWENINISSFCLIRGLYRTCFDLVILRAWALSGSHSTCSDATKPLALRLFHGMLDVVQITKLSTVTGIWITGILAFFEAFYESVIAGKCLPKFCSGVLTHSWRPSSLLNSARSLPSSVSFKLCSTESWSPLPKVSFLCAAMGLCLMLEVLRAAVELWELIHGTSFLLSCTNLTLLPFWKLNFGLSTMVWVWLLEEVIKILWFNRILWRPFPSSKMGVPKPPLKEMCQPIMKIHWVHIYKEANVPADTLAKKSLHSSTTLKIFLLSS